MQNFENEDEVSKFLDGQIGGEESLTLIEFRRTRRLRALLMDRFDPHLRRAQQPARLPRRADSASSAKFRQNVARFRLYRRRSLQLNTRFAAFFKIYQIT